MKEILDLKQQIWFYSRVKLKILFMDEFYLRNNEMGLECLYHLNALGSVYWHEIGGIFIIATNLSSINLIVYFLVSSHLFFLVNFQILTIPA